MASYWARRRKVRKLLRDTEQDILSEYGSIAASSSGNLHSIESTTPLITNSSESFLDALPSTSGLLLTTPEIGTDKSECGDDSDNDIGTDKSECGDDSDNDMGTDKSECGDDSDNNIGTDKSECGDGPNEGLLTRSLKYWATTYSVSLVALSALLTILRLFHPTLPKDGRTLLGTKAHVATVKIDGGDYYHFGLIKGVLSRLACLKLPRTLNILTLQFNIDGLPLFRSSKLQFWPILACITCDYTKTPFPIGIFCGLSKPKSVFQYLQKFTITST